MSTETYVVTAEWLKGLLRAQWKHHQATNKIQDVGIELPADVEVDLLDMIADLVGIPPHDEAAHQESPPPGSYSRDWIRWTWFDHGPEALWEAMQKELQRLRAASE